MWFPIWKNQSIMIKVFIIGIVLTTHVTSVTPVLAAYFIGHFKSLIYPVPDKSALHIFASTNNVPVFFEITGAITHSMSIFTHNKWTFHIFACSVFFHIRYAWVHRANYVSIFFFMCLLKLN